MANKQEKYIQYAALLSEMLAEAFTGDGNVTIDPQELEEGDNLTHFFHALANVMPNHIYNKITGDNKNNLEFNHVANMLVFQFSKTAEDDLQTESEDEA